MKRSILNNTHNNYFVYPDGMEIELGRYFFIVKSHATNKSKYSLKNFVIVHDHGDTIILNYDTGYDDMFYNIDKEKNDKVKY